MKESRYIAIHNESLLWAKEEQWEYGIHNEFCYFGDKEIDPSAFPEHLRFKLSKCSYCGEILSESVNKFYDCLHLCNSCGWWVVFSSSLAGHPHQWQVGKETVYEGIVKKFNIDSISIPQAELIKHLARHKEDFNSIHPTAFEHIMASIYRDFFNCEVRHVGGPGDNGIDLYVVIAEVPHLVQIKRRINRKKAESVHTVREFIGALVLSGAKRGHIVTTTDSFSPAAIKSVNSNQLRRYNISIELKNLQDVIAMLGIANEKNREPWMQYYEH